MATGVCHTDAYTLSGCDPEGLFPSILGHEGAGIVREVGAGVTSVKPGDHVIPLYTPECRQCKCCLSRRTNLCTAIRATQGKGLMPDGTSRFSFEGQPIAHYMGCSTFSNFTVLPEIAVAKVRADAPFDKICYIGCGVTTGVGAVIYTAKVWPGANVVVFGLGGIGLNVIQGARMVGADKIIGVDLNPAKAEMAQQVRHDPLRQSRRGRPRQGGAGDRRPDRRRRRLLLRVHRQRRTPCARRWSAATAAGARASSSAWPPSGTGDLHPPVPAGHRPGLEGLGLRRRARPHRRAQDRRLVHGGEDQHRRSDHPHPAAGEDQRRLRPDARRRKHPQRGGFLMHALEIISEAKCFGGRQISYRHASSETKTPMRFSVFLPPQAEHEAVPVLWWLSGLTCTEDNFPQKAGAQRIAAELGLMLVNPDTSPRGPALNGEDVPDDPDGAYDLGLGAGFYLDATQEPWAANYRMYAYVAHELPEIVAENLPADMTRQAISGHSMGGHGALTIGLKNPGRFRSISAFAPIVAPSHCPWGRKAFSNYLGPDPSKWGDYDATALVENGARTAEILIDQGSRDPWLETELLPEQFETVCAQAGQPLLVRRHQGYDHGYFFISSFIEDHLRWHGERLF